MRRACIISSLVSYPLLDFAVFHRHPSGPHALRYYTATVLIYFPHGIDYHHYMPGDIVFLSDEARDPRSQPTRKNMINAMRWLVQGAKKHDALFFHCGFLLFCAR